MNYLSKFTPAETLMFIERSQAPYQDLMQFTFMDLLLKKVLKSEETFHKPSKYDVTSVITYISPGPNFDKYASLPHQDVFLDFFRNNKNKRIINRHFVKIGYGNSKNRKKYIELILQSGNISPFIKKNLLHKLFGGFGLSIEGYEIEKSINDELAKLDRELSDFLINDKEKALGIIKRVWGNIFLLNNLDYKKIQGADKKLFDDINPNQSFFRTNSYRGKGWGVW
jgi:hypothetical protein